MENQTVAINHFKARSQDKFFYEKGRKTNSSKSMKY